MFNQILKGNFRNALRYKLWLIGYQTTLPAFIIRQIPIIENGEALVEIPQHPKIICIAPQPFVRESVAKMLVKVADNLPQNLYLKILYAYRDQETQKRFWDEVVRDTSSLQIAKSLSAKPGGIGPHQTGAAVDVTLTDSLGNELDMGTHYRDHSNIAKIPMFAKTCTPIQKQNRKLLRQAMTRSGFYFYPGEWWHYSYGDQSWVAYTGDRNAVYGEKTL